MKGLVNLCSVFDTPIARNDKRTSTIAVSVERAKNFSENVTSSHWVNNMRPRKPKCVNVPVTQMTFESIFNRGPTAETNPNVIKNKLVQKLVNSLLLQRFSGVKLQSLDLPKGSFGGDRYKDSPIRTITVDTQSRLLGFHKTKGAALRQGISSSMTKQIARPSKRLGHQERRKFAESWTGESLNPPLCLREDHRSPTLWRISNGEIGVIFKKGDFPKLMQKKLRLQKIIANKIEREKDVVRMKYMVNHPAVKLLEKNINKIYANEIFINEKGFNALKDFNGLNFNVSNSSKQHQNVYDELGFLNIKQKMHIRKRIAKGSFSSTFYT